MAIGAFSILLACFLWSLGFIIPQFIPSASALEITLGRFFFFGVISTYILLIYKRHLLGRQFSFLWKKAALLSFVSSLFCYGSTVLAIRLAGVPITVLLFGMSPLAISLYGNFKEKEYPTKIFLIPGLCLLIGATLLHKDAFALTGDPLNVTLGAFSALLSLASWTWFAVVNSAFLKKNPDLSQTDWLIFLGVTCFVFVLLICLILLCIPSYSFTFLSSSFAEQKNFLFYTSLLGILGSWIPFFLWNYGSRRIYVTLAGQLAQFETPFSFILLFLIEKRFPFFLETTAICLTLAGFFLFFLQSRKYLPKTNS